MNKRLSPEIASLKRKISLTEILILFLLIIVWVGMFWIAGVQKEKYVHTMVAFQEQILALADGRAGNAGVFRRENWPFHDAFRYFIARDARIVSSNLPGLEGGDIPLEKAFGGFINSQEVIPRMRMSMGGTDWIRPDKISSRIWISWSASGNSGYIFGIVSDEDDLLSLTGYPDFRLVLLASAVLASALLLLALIWALSWMRLSAVKGLLRGR